MDLILSEISGCQVAKIHGRIYQEKIKVDDNKDRRKGCHDMGLLIISASHNVASVGTPPSTSQKLAEPYVNTTVFSCTRQCLARQEYKYTSIGMVSIPPVVKIVNLAQNYAYYLLS